MYLFVIDKIPLRAIICLSIAIFVPCFDGGVINITKYIVKRLGMSLLTLFLLICLIFAMMHAIPGGPFTTDRSVTEAVAEALNDKYHLNDTVIVQFGNYLRDLAHGDLGVSYQYRGMSINEFINSGFPVSGKLGLVTILFVLLTSIPMGIVAALKNNRWQDMAMMAIATLGVTIPSFVIATMLMFVFSYQLNILPTFGLASWKGFILPMIALGGYHLAFLARLMRSSLLEAMGQDYIRTARSKGISEVRTVVRHGLRNALIPVITVLGPTTANLITGSFVIESIFALPGLGVHFVSSISNRDYSAIMGLTIFYAAFLIAVVFLVDIFYCLIDPRIRYD
jgi:oligopeptide transport system permease protein